MPPKNRAGSTSKAKSKQNPYIGCSFSVPRSILDAADARILPASVREIELTVDSLKPGTRTYVCEGEYTDAAGRKAGIRVHFSSKILGTLVTKKRKTPVPRSSSEQEGKPVCTAMPNLRLHV
jgi:hypothetical protein